MPEELLMRARPLAAQLFCKHERRREKRGRWRGARTRGGHRFVAHPYCCNGENVCLGLFQCGSSNGVARREGGGRQRRFVARSPPPPPPLLPALGSLMCVLLRAHIVKMSPRPRPFNDRGDSQLLLAKACNCTASNRSSSAGRVGAAKCNYARETNVTGRRRISASG